MKNTNHAHSVTDFDTSQSEAAVLRKNIFKKVSNRRTANNQVINESKEKTRFSKARLPNSSRLRNYDPEKKPMYTLEPELPSSGLMDEFTLATQSGESEFTFGNFGNYSFGAGGGFSGFGGGLSTEGMFNGVSAGTSTNSFGAAGFNLGSENFNGFGYSNADNGFNPAAFGNNNFGY